MKRLISVVCIIAMLAGIFAVSAVNADAELVREYSLSFTGREAINNRVTAGSLAEEVRAEYGMGANDIVGSASIDVPYVAHMANNGYVWEKQANGSYKKSYGGIEGYYGFYREQNSTAEFAVTSSNDTHMSVLNLDGNVLQIMPYGNIGYNCYGTFGRYDLDLSGVTKFRTVILPINMRGGKMVSQLQLVQGKATGSDSCDKVYTYLTVDENNGVHFDDPSSEAICTLTPYTDTSWSATPEFYEAIYVLDNSGSEPRHSLKIINAKTGEQLAHVPMTSLNQEFTVNSADACGSRVRAFSVNGWTGDKRLLVKSMQMSKKPIAVKSFTERFLRSKYGWTSGCITGSTVDETTRTQYGIGADDIIGDRNGGEYRASAANNMYVWNLTPEGGYEKKYCGIPGFYGYLNHKSSPALNKTFAEYLGVVNAGNDGVLGMTSVGNAGYNQYTSFGRYDLDITGKSVFTAKIGVVGGTPGTVTMKLAQGKKVDSDAVDAESEILRIKDNKIYIAGSSEPAAQLNAMSINNINKNDMLTVMYYLDNSTAKPQGAVEIYKADGSLAAATEMAAIDTAATKFDFTESVGGIAFKSELSGRWDTNYRFILDDITFSNGAAPDFEADGGCCDSAIIVNASGTDKTATAILAAYSDNTLINVKLTSLELKAGARVRYDADLTGLPEKGSYSVKSILWDGDGNMTPIRFTSSTNDFAQEIRLVQ